MGTSTKKAPVEKKVYIVNIHELDLLDPLCVYGLTNITSVSSVFSSPNQTTLKCIVDLFPAQVCTPTLDFKKSWKLSISVTSS